MIFKCHPGGVEIACFFFFFSPTGKSDECGNWNSNFECFGGTRLKQDGDSVKKYIYLGVVLTRSNGFGWKLLCGVVHISCNVC